MAIQFIKRRWVTFPMRLLLTSRPDLTNIMRLLAWTDKKVRAHNAPLLPHKGGGYGTRTVEAVVRFGGRGRQVASGPRPLYDGIYRRHFSVGGPPRSARFVGLPTGKLARGPWLQPAAVAI